MINELIRTIDNTKINSAANMNVVKRTRKLKAVSLSAREAEISC